MNLETKTIAAILNLPNTKFNVLSKSPKSSKSLKSSQSLQTKYINQIPKNAFGVFATIRRSIKLPNYPEDIHGCIGYWSPDYKVLSQKEIISHLMDVSHSAMYNDNRRKYFPPIETDPDTIIEIDFMLEPLIPINEINGELPNGELFKNSKYGLIVEGKNKLQRATYLPNVFPDKTKWLKLKESLISKAGVSNTSNISITNNKNNKINFFAYTIIQLKAKLFDVINIKSISKTIN